MTPTAGFRSLATIAIGGLVLGVATVIITVVTWPTWDPVQTAANASVILGQQVDPSEMTAPTYVERWAWIAIGGVLTNVGIVAGLLTFHAAAVRFDFQPKHVVALEKASA